MPTIPLPCFNSNTVYPMMLDYHDALRQLLASLQPVSDTIPLPLDKASGHVLAADLPALYDTPQFDNSAMDGYAVADPEGNSTCFMLAGRIAAGESPELTLQAGQAARIFTGAPVPAGATTVVPQEDVQTEGDTLILAQPARAGAHIRRRSEEYAAGGTLLKQGTLLDPAAVALAASQGHAALPVLRPLRVAVFSSGNELREPGTDLAPGQIYDANRYQMLAWLAGMPVEVVLSGCLPDDAAITRERLQAASTQADVILTSGGVSVGEEDHVRAALADIGQLDVWKLAIKPGKPFAWGSAGQARVFMLPGNPVATFVTFFMLVAPALRKLQGLPQPEPLAVQAVSGFERLKREPRREFLRAVAQAGPDGRWHVSALQGQGSAMLSACVQANVLAEIAPDTPVAVGDPVTIYPLPGKGWF